MNLAIIGCSYSNFWDGDIFGKTYPKLIADDYPDINIYDASLGGAGNDSCYLRLQNIEKNFGSIDKIIVQLTLPYRSTVVLNKKAIKSFMQWEHENNYYYSGQSSRREIKGCIFITPGSIREHSFLINWKKYFKARYHAIDYFHAWVNSYDVFWQIQKEIDLINSKYGEENVLFFSWLKEDRKSVSLPKNYVGSVQEKFGTDMEKYSIDKVLHFNEEGHKAIYKWLNPYIKPMVS